MYKKLNGPEGIAVAATVLMAFLFIFFLGLGALGGTIGASFTRRDQRR